MRVAVVGAGVSGLTCATLLAQIADVSVFYDRPWSETTSAIATAMWHVYLVDPKDDNVLLWASRSMSHLLEIEASSPEAGVSRVLGVELYRRPTSAPVWAHIPPHFRMLDQAELARFPSVEAGFVVETVLADMRLYLPWLESAARSQGVEFQQRTVSDLEQISNAYSVVINCSGLGARTLVPDTSVRPVRGQYIVLPRLDSRPLEYVGDDENPAGMAYVVPRANDVLVGGTEEYDVADLTFTQDVAEMLERSTATAPWLSRYSEQDVLARVVGLRPYRAAGVRLEESMFRDGRRVVHNYGHGGSGFSLSWGCAETVADLVARDARSSR